MDTAELNSENIQCGRIALSIDSFSSKGKIIVYCSFCEDYFDGFPDYKSHLLIEHYPQIELEDCLKQRNCQNNKVENNSGNKEDYSNASTIEFIKFLQMDFNKSDNDSFFDIQKIIESDDGSSIKDFPTKQNIIKESDATNTKYDKNKKCPHCDREFFLSSSLEHHLERHRKAGDSIGGIYKCNLCKAEFDLKCSLMLHIREHGIRKNTPNYVETVTSEEKKKASESLLKRPNIIKETAFCKSNLSNIASKTLSKNNTSDVEESMDINNIVNSSNVSELGDTYEISNTTIEPEEFHCEVCNKKFSGQSRFNAHMNRHKPCEFKCTNCNKQFKTAGELQTHTRFHTGEKPYLCAKCGETFATVSKLINHTRRHHTFERTKQCPICKKKFYAAGELKVHLQSTHSNERPYNCKLCAATFNRPFSLRTHMKSHDNKREYKCNFCPASFNQKCNLNSHQKKAHCLLTDEGKRM